MKSLLKIIFLFLFLVLTSCSFQTSFFKEINKKYINKNVVVSPLSAYQILGLTANGANGKTLEEMLLVLENKDLDELNSINTEILNIAKDLTTIEIANAIMTAFTPRKNFSSIASKYQSTVESLKSVAQVNNWCNKKTHGKITKILDQLDPNTVMVLLNAIYFKGSWRIEFPEKSTKPKKFYNFNDNSKYIETDMMSIKDKFLYYQDNELEIIELPYTKDSMSAIILLPNKDININDFIAKLNDAKLEKLLKKMIKSTVQLQMPKFELEFSSSLNDVLQNLGMVEPFSDAADFTGMKEKNDIYIDKVIQKTYLKVDEKGTEAAAVTAITMTTKSASARPLVYSMIVDRPFLFMLKNSKFPKNYEMVFMSKIEEL